MKKKMTMKEKMDLVAKNFGDDVISMVIFGKANSIGSKVSTLEPESFMIAILTTDNDVNPILEKHGFTFDKCIKKLKSMLKKKGGNANGAVTLSNITITKDIETMCLKAYEMVPKKEVVHAVHFFLAIVDSFADIKKAFEKNSPDKDFDVSLKELRAII